MDTNNFNKSNELNNFYQTYNVQVEPNEKKVDFFSKIFIPTLIYAIIYTFCLYDNFCGILVPAFAVSTIVYSLYCLKALGVKAKKGTIVYAVAIILLGIASCISANAVIIICNTLGMIFFIVNMLLHNFYEDGAWGFLKYIGSWFLSIFGAIGCLFDPFGDLKAYQNQGKEGKKGKHIYIIIGILVSIPVLAILVALLCNADIVFKNFVENIFKDVDFLTIIGIICMFVFAFFSAYCGIRYLDKHSISEKNVECKRLNSVIAITVASFVSVVYLVFSAIQFVYLFAGNMKLPAGYTYSQYVHEGFNQLLFVCILNLVLVIVGNVCFEENLVLKLLLSLISVCTYIMIASSAYRMCMYVSVYGLTGLRVAVYWGLAVLAVLFIGVIISIYNSSFNLYNFSLFVIALFYIVMAFAKPDYVIADFNLHMLPKLSSVETDYGYLAELSPDAAPAIKGEEGAWVEEYAFRLIGKTDYSFRQYNFSMAKARKLFAKEIKAKENTTAIKLMIDEQTQPLVADKSIRILIDDEEVESTCSDSTKTAYIAFIPTEEDEMSKMRRIQVYFEKPDGEEKSSDRTEFYTTKNKVSRIVLTNDEDPESPSFYVYDGSYMN